jgi:hypothetical protein
MEIKTFEIVEKIDDKTMKIKFDGENRVRKITNYAGNVWKINYNKNTRYFIFHRDAWSGIYSAKFFNYKKVSVCSWKILVHTFLLN